MTLVLANEQSVTIKNATNRIESSEDKITLTVNLTGKTFNELVDIFTPEAIATMQLYRNDVLLVTYAGYELSNINTYISDDDYNSNIEFSKAL